VHALRNFISPFGMPTRLPAVSHFASKLLQALRPLVLHLLDSLDCLPFKTVFPYRLILGILLRGKMARFICKYISLHTVNGLILNAPTSGIYMILVNNNRTFHYVGQSASLQSRFLQHQAKIGHPHVFLPVAPGSDKNLRLATESDYISNLHHHF
jgi:hypothetical protein